MLFRSLAEIQQVLRAHLEALHDFYGEHAGLRIARKHIGWTLDRLPGGPELKRRFNRLETAAEQFQLLDGITALPRAA